MHNVLRTTKSLIASVGAIAVLTTGGVVAGVVVSGRADADPGNVRANGGLNVRSGPGTDYRVIGGLTNGAPIDSTGPAENGFYPIDFGDGTGWISSRYVDTSGVGESTQEAPAEGEAYATTEVYVRTGPSVDHRSAGMLFRGERVVLTGERSGQYSEITYAGGTGWTATQYLAQTWATGGGGTETGDGGGSDDAGSGEQGSSSDGSSSGGSSSDDSSSADGSQSPSDDDGTVVWSPAPSEDSDASEDSDSDDSGSSSAPDPVVSADPTEEPSPTTEPSSSPSATPSKSPSATSSTTPSASPSKSPSVSPSQTPSPTASATPTTSLSATPSKSPSATPSTTPSATPTKTPSATPTPEPEPELPKIKSQAVATADLNIRTSENADHKVVKEVKKGTELDLTGVFRNGMAQIVFEGAVRWVNATYLDGPDVPEPEAEELPKTTGTRYATTALDIRTSSGSDSRTVAEVPPGTELKITGKEENGRAEIVYRDAVRWVTAKYLSKSKPSEEEEEESGNDDKIELDGLTADTDRLLSAVQDAFPQIKTIYGKRTDPGSDHHSGRAIDLMLPNYKSNKALGNEIAAWAKDNASEYNIDYVVWYQQIWSVQRSKEGWRDMADRGSDTQNHIDHVHISVKASSSTASASAASTKSASTDTSDSDDQESDSGDGSESESESDSTSAKTETCKASYYSTGKVTANGESFDPSGMTAAHKTLPFDTKVKVTNKANGKSVTVRINDRGPFIDGRCLDLAEGAFTKIADTNSGVIDIEWSEV